MTVRYETDGPIAIVTIDRLDVANAVDAETAERMVEAFEKFDADPDLSVAILTGAGGKFSAGGDLKAMMEGHAVAGGLELALGCDLRVAARDAVFGVYCRRWGIPLCDGGTVRLPRLIGQSQALDMILTGRGVSGEEAARMGLVNRLCEPGEALETARRLAITLARLPQACLRSDRKSMYEQWETDVATALRRESELGLEVIGSGEVGRGLTHWRSGAWSFSDFAEA